MARFNEQDDDFYKPVMRDKERIDSDLEVFRNLDNYVSTKANFEDDVPEEERNEVSFYAWYNDLEPCFSREELAQKLADKEATFLVEDGKVVESYYFCNPDAKYDYYCVIGSDSFARFQGVEFVMKDGTKKNSGRIGDLDIDATVAECVEEAREDYRKVFDAIGILNHIPWTEFLIRRDKGEITIDEARTLYNAQEDVRRFNKWAGENNFYFLDADDFRCTEDEYVKDVTFPCFSANILGEWLEKAEMGWWGLTSNDKESAVWKDMLESALRKAQEENPDEEFHVLDCHI